MDLDETLPTAEPQAIHTSGDLSTPPDLRLLHFNDVYHIDASSAEPVGGIARFMTVCNEYRSDPRYNGQSNILTFFSGDAFNPSLESSVTKGSHMVPILNAIGTDVACVGNHDLDFGVKQFRHLARQCTFPWLLANVLDPALGEDVPLGNAQRTILLTSSNGVKVGVIGLVEREWLDTINSLPPGLIYKSVSATAKELIPGLRARGAQVIIAVTHQREPNDIKLAEKTPGGLIDIVLGGHDHFYQHRVINGTHVLRSGSDFKQLSYLELRKKGDGSAGWDISIVKRDIVSSVSQDEATLQLTEKLTTSLKGKLGKPLGYTVAPLDARFTTVRMRESNIGNFICDLMRSHYNGDCAIIAAGTIRGDQIYPPGMLRVKDIMNCFPFEDPCVVIRVTGQAIYLALENAVSQYPALEGRFPQVSNIEFEFDATRERSNRINYVKIAGTALELKKRYVLVTRGYMARGKDGFDSLLVRSEGGEAEEIVSEENGILISMMLRQYFMSLKIMGQWKLWGKSMDRHWRQVHKSMSTLHLASDLPHKSGPPAEQNPSIPSDVSKEVSTTEGAVKIENLLDESDDDLDNSNVGGSELLAEKKERELQLARKITKKWWRLAGLAGHPKCCDEVAEFNIDWTRAIAPRLEGRIRILTDATNREE